ncbi:hypothetical protein A3J15_01530 [Candidatus Roizmanbacteria bacterium RIFCSPLOWO2_02_FULL_38_10]|uniref:Probable DNA 3'-5' helicase RecG n=1 Tax=Candidatus Roizmanbacteria bacterium RIFCSPLOWO2_02_FULL_38_10 TaxID=1802074 RepID=A0A1F7JP60_9BACT|nr:MAG: hypothetical protein A3J15_01530 [Candidatus Roizmanbacteria bacterium RIFCSPLOWO2_02_FULL_38_10]
MLLTDPVDQLPATSAMTKRKMINLGIRSIFDLLHYYPHRVENYMQPVQISALNNLFNPEIQSSNITVKGIITDTHAFRTKTGKFIFKARLTDDSGFIDLVWFNQRYLVSLLKSGLLIQVSGKIDFSGSKNSIIVNSFELLSRSDQQGVHTGGLIPVYSEKNGLSSRLLRDKIHLCLKLCLDQVIEYLPENILHKFDLISEKLAIKNIHNPEKIIDFEKARIRLSFDEMFGFQLLSQIRRNQINSLQVAKQYSMTNVHRSKIKSFITRLPFKLTNDQQKAVEVILADLQKNQPMNRLLQGEVGSGKTVVAALAAYFVFLNNQKTVILAPTEILCHQHYATLNKLFNNDLKIVTLLSSSKPKKHDLLQADIIIGTTALIHKQNIMDVGLVVIDEQHKFGVTQRAIMKKITGQPHFLTMTATPIPRTVLLTLYGQLEVTRINQLPKNRLTPKSFLVPLEKRNDAYNWIKKQIQENKIQVFLICPLIDESDHETLKDIKAVNKEYSYLKTTVFPEFTVSLLHGKMKANEKSKIMANFEKGKIDILISTSVVEVGIDVPNASIIVIESADRYGLAQLHQLRGRVGRGHKQSYCLLFTEKNQDQINSRLKVFTSTSNGFELAEYDLKNRGAGDIFGTKQHGIPHLKIADYSDLNLIRMAQDAAEYIFQRKTLLSHPHIQQIIRKSQANLYSAD